MRSYWYSTISTIFLPSFVLYKFIFGAVATGHSDAPCITGSRTATGTVADALVDIQRGLLGRRIPWWSTIADYVRQSFANLCTLVLVGHGWSCGQMSQSISWYMMILPVRGWKPDQLFSGVLSHSISPLKRKKSTTSPWYRAARVLW